jgi:aspartyl-tRNA(Asn)/glutamyl-tRNA(Gln) amidotransferase subunit C
MMLPGFASAWSGHCSFLSSRLANFGPRIACSRQTRWLASVQVDRDVVVKTARLAQLELSDDEIEKLTPEFQKMIGFVETISELDLEGVEPMSRVEDTTNVWREDVPVSFPDV